MNTTTKPAPKVFDYAALIDELRELGQRANDFEDEVRNAESIPFKVWRARLVQLVDQAKRHGMHFKCNVQMRRFESVYPDRALNARAFNEAMTDTLVEIAEAIKWFDTYGPPTDPAAKPATAPAMEDKPAPLPPTPPEWPKGEKLNYAWFRDHVPASVWLGCLGALGVAFGAGVNFGNSALYKSVTEPASHVTAQPAKAASK